MTQTTSTVPQAVNVYFTRDLIKRALAFRQFERFADMSRDIPMKKGQVVRWRKYNSLALATNPLTEGVSPAGKSPTPTDIPATISQYGDYIKFTDVLSYTEDDGVLNENNQLLSEQAADSLDILTANVLLAGTNVVRVNARGSRGAVLSGDLLDTATLNKARRTLHVDKVKPIKRIIDGSPKYGSSSIAAAYVSIVHPLTEYTLDTLTGFTPVDKYANQKDIMEGEIGKYKDLRFVRSEQMPYFAGEGDSGTDVYATLILGRHAYGLTKLAGKSMEVIIKALGYGEDPLNQRGSHGWKTFFVAKILNQLNILRVEHSVAS